jgi:hypothetical protein
MSAYQLFRLLCVVFVLVLAALGAADYWDYITDKTFAIIAAVIACLVAVFAAFAPKPLGQEVAGAVDRVITGYPADVLLRLQEQTQQAQTLRNFIEIESNQIFLRKMQAYLEGAIMDRYKGSDIEKLIKDLSDVEARMQQANVTMSVAELPQELRRTINRIEQGRDEIAMLKRYIEIMPMPGYFRGVLAGTVDVFAWFSRR